MPALSLPVTTFSTPAGTPASTARRAMARAQSGVSAAGLTTTVQPLARAGPTLRVIMAIGKFQGAMAAHTPTGCLIDIRRLPGIGVGMLWP